MMLTRRTALTAAATLAASLVSLAGPARAGEPPIHAAGGLAIGGYDPVAYFTQNAAVRGDPAIQLMWMGATWRFASAANREAFERMPQKYAPAYGGYCAYAASQGYVAPTDPEAFTLHDGRLFLNYSKRVRQLWEGDKPGHISAGDANWPGLLSN